MTTHTIVYSNLITATGALAIVDAEAEQAVVAHGPELPLLCQPFLLLRCKHAHHRVHLHLIAGNVAVLYLTPGEPRHVGLYLAEVDHVGDVIGEIQFEVLASRMQADHEDEAAGKQNPFSFHRCVFLSVSHYSSSSLSHSWLSLRLLSASVVPSLGLNWSLLSVAASMGTFLVLTTRTIGF